MGDGGSAQRDGADDDSAAYVGDAPGAANADTLTSSDDALPIAVDATEPEADLGDAAADDADDDAGPSDDGGLTPVPDGSDTGAGDDATTLDAPAFGLDTSDSAGPGNDAQADAATDVGPDGAIDAPSDTATDAASSALLVISEGPTYDFGAWGTSTSTHHFFFVENQGSQPASAVVPSGLGGAFSFRGGDYPGLGGSCGTTLAAGARCAVVVAFAPSSLGMTSSSFTLTYASQSGPSGLVATRAVTGTGVNAASLRVSDFPRNYYLDYGMPTDPATYDFGPVGVGRSVTHTFYVVNTGAVPATSLTAPPLAAPFSVPGGFPGNGGSCGATLAPGAECTIVGAFSPTAAAAASAPLSIGFHDGTTTRSATRTLTGSGTVLAAVRLWDHPGLLLGAAWDFGSTGLGQGRSHTFYLVNEGAAKATTLGGSVSGAGFSFRGGSFPGTSGTCGSELDAGAECTLEVEFLPLIGGAASGRLDVTYAGGAAGSLRRDLMGGGTTRALLELLGEGGAPVISFGTRGVGTTGEIPLRVRNRGALTATGLSPGALAAPFGHKGGAFPGGGTCSSTLAIGAECTFIVTFSPALAQGYGAAIALTYGDAQGSGLQVQKALQGTGTSLALLEIRTSRDRGDSAGDEYDFGAWGTPTTRRFYVVNVGAVAASSLAPSGPAAPFSFKDGAYPGTGGSCSSSLAAGATCEIVLAYTGAASGRSTLTLTFADGGSGGTATKALSGTAVTGPLLTVTDCTDCGSSSTAYDFGALGVGRTRVRLLTVQNRGGATATAISDAGGLGASFRYAGAGFPGVTPGCGTTLTPGATCQVGLEFAPASAGTKSGSVTLSYSDGVTTRTAARLLEGIATDAALLVVRDPGGGGYPNAAYDFGVSGTAQDRTFTLENEGAATATGMSGLALTDGFSWKGGAFPGGGTCGATLGAGQSCTVVVTFTPSGNGPHGTTLTVTYDGGGQASRGLTATATTAAFLTISEYSGGSSRDMSYAPPYDFGTWGIAVDRTFYLRNTGAVAATALSPAALGNDFGWKNGSYPGSTSGAACGGTLAPGTTCEMIVTFTPAGTGGRTSAISLGYQDGTTSRSATRTLQGTATNRAFLRLREATGVGGPSTAFDFGTWGVNVERTFNLSNDGGADATALVDGSGLAGLFAWGGGGATFPGGGTCGATLAKGASCTVIAAFKPTGNGPASASVSVAYDDGATTQVASRAVVGVATTRAYLVFTDWGSLTDCQERCGPFDFGNRGVGATSEHTFTVFNTGAVTATSLGGLSGGPFAWKGSLFPGSMDVSACAAALAANANCTVIGTFTPIAIGAATGTLGVSYHDGATNTSSLRSVRGSGQ